MTLNPGAKRVWLGASLLWTAVACAPLHDEAAGNDEGWLGEEHEALIFDPRLAYPLRPPLPPLLPPPACSNVAVWVGPPGMRTCPVIRPAPTGSFRAQPLFGAGAPAELSRACLYEWTPSAFNAGPDLGFLGLQLSNFGQPAPELDCPVVSALGPPAPIARELWRALEGQLTTQAAQPTSPYRVAAPVRVAVLDTAALPYNRTGDFDNYGHGRVVGRLIDSLACQPSMAGLCPVRIENELALPLTRAFKRDDVRGGVFGSRAQLADAIHRAILRWSGQQPPSGGSPERLVLNFSVGWDPMHGGASGIEASMNPASRVVFQALKRAACLGAANVAAAGNAEPGARDGAMLPGGWQSVALPTGAACAGYVGLSSDRPLLAAMRPIRTSYATLVTAASGVDQADRPLTLTRTGSTPHLVAYALNGVTSDPRSSHTMSVTGTSVSTAVLSAALASVWSIDPDLSASDALDIVYQSAIPLVDAYGRNRQAELTLPGVSLPTRRVAVCDAARLAMCLRAGCAVEFSCNTPTSGAGRLSAGPVLVRNPAPPRLLAEACREGTCVTNPPYVVRPWVGPQPGRPGCPSCVVDSFSGLIRLTLPEAATIRGLAVELDGASHRVALPRGASAYPPELSIEVSSARTTTRANLLIEAEDETGRSVRSEPLSVY